MQVQVHEPSAIVAEAEFTTPEPGHTRPIPVYDCNDPASMGVEDLYGRPLPPAVDVRAESGTVGSGAPLILIHADSAVDSLSPPPPLAMTTSRRDPPLPPLHPAKEPTFMSIFTSPMVYAYTFVESERTGCRPVLPCQWPTLG